MSLPGSWVGVRAAAPLLEGTMSAMPQFPPPAVTPRPSYGSGVSDKPLLGETIGANLDLTAALFPDPGRADRYPRQRAVRAALGLA